MILKQHWTEYLEIPWKEIWATMNLQQCWCRLMQSLFHVCLNVILTGSHDFRLIDIPNHFEPNPWGQHAVLVFRTLFYPSFFDSKYLLQANWLHPPPTTYFLVSLQSVTCLSDQPAQYLLFACLLPIIFFLSPHSNQFAEVEFFCFSHDYEKN